MTNQKITIDRKEELNHRPNEDKILHAKRLLKNIEPKTWLCNCGIVNTSDCDACDYCGETIDNGDKIAEHFKFILQSDAFHSVGNSQNNNGTFENPNCPELNQSDFKQ